jgi:hypothetical protein
MSHRYFRTDTDAVYEQVRLGLDAAWQHVPPTTCIKPAALAFRDNAGRIVLAVRLEFAEFPAAAAMLPDLLANGAVEEIDAATYHGVVNPAE